MDNIKIGQSYQCHAIGVENEVVGIIEHLYDNTAVISVITCDPHDRAQVIELQNKLLVKYENIHTCLKVECPA